MDKREEKTLNKIHYSFTKLINEKDYENITIQDILDDSKVSRSTFYAHYKTKDELLLSVTNHIFTHVFSKTLEEEKTHDFSIRDLKCEVVHCHDFGLDPLITVRETFRQSLKSNFHTLPLRKTQETNSTLPHLR